MRIVSGKFKGKHFSPPAGFEARPTTDFAKESLFNVLNNIVDFESIKVLDLFSGTGSISYEFLSRGCTDVTSVELNRKHQRFIAESFKALNCNNEARSVLADSFKFVEKVHETYDLIFADPPFDLETAENLPDMISKFGLLKEDGIFILEHAGHGKYNDHHLFQQTRNYGKVNFTFFCSEKTNQDE